MYAMAMYFWFCNYSPLEKYQLLRGFFKYWIEFVPVGLFVLTHWGRDKMAAIFQTTFFNAFSWMKMYEFRLTFSLKFVPRGPINNIPTLVQVMAWRRPGDKLLSEPMMVRLPTHICVTRPQWVKFSNGVFDRCQQLPDVITYPCPNSRIFLYKSSDCCCPVDMFCMSSCI